MGAEASAYRARPSERRARGPWRGGNEYAAHPEPVRGSGCAARVVAGRRARSGYSPAGAFAAALVRGLVAFALGASGEESVAATPLTSAVAAGSEE